MKHASMFHPLLWGVSPVLFLWAQNSEHARLPQVAMGILFAVSLAAVLMVVGWAGMRDRHRRSAIAFLALVLFFGYGRAFEAIVGREWISSHSLCHWLLGGMTALILGVGIVALRRVRHPQGISRVLMAMGIIMIALSVVRLPWRGALVATARPTAFEGAVERRLETPRNAGAPADEESSYPDVYYIILDGYAREDVLKAVYDYDNGAFTSWLREKGFYVAEESAANYPMTHFSLASSMNLNYLDTVLECLPRYPESLAPFYELTRNPLVGQLFQAHGYRFIHFATNFRGTEDSGIADEIVSSDPLWLQNEFMQVLLRTTAARGLGLRMADLHLESFRALAQMPSRPGPKFVFAHFILPHHPYVFDRHGNVRHDVLMDLDFKHGTGGWRDREPYLEQLIYATELVREAIESILKNSSHQPIIVLQSDHGSGATMGRRWSNVRTDTFLRERLPILNAYLVPPQIRSNLYPSISPVNSFRIVCNGLFQSGFELLPDRHYMAWYNWGTRTIDVTERVRKGAPSREDVQALLEKDAHDELRSSLMAQRGAQK